MSGDFERSIAAIIMSEGLAMHASRHIIPSAAASHYVEHEPGWFKTCRLKKDRITKGLFLHLRDRSAEVVRRFTFGTHTTGEAREVCYGAWEIVGTCLKDGVSYKTLAGIEEEAMPDFLEASYFNRT